METGVHKEGACPGLFCLLAIVLLLATNFAGTAAVYCSSAAMQLYLQHGDAVVPVDPDRQLCYGRQFLQDPMVGREHFAVSMVDGTLVLENLHSNGAQLLPKRCGT